MATQQNQQKLSQELAKLTLDLINIPSESHDEKQLFDWVCDWLTSHNVDFLDCGDLCLIAGNIESLKNKDSSKRKIVALSGHLDTVPAQGNRPGRIDGDLVYGLGTADMKGSVAVMLQLLAAGTHLDEQRKHDLVVLLFPREELPFVETALTPMIERFPAIKNIDLGVVMEPTDLQIQGGCLGNLNATWTFNGVAAHSARPWQGKNAIHIAAKAISQLAEVEPKQHMFSNLEYAECVSITKIEGGIAANVVPSKVSAHINYRYPPGMTAKAADAQLADWCSVDDSELAIISNAPSGEVCIDNPLAQDLIKLTARPVDAKQAWTPVAELTAAGIDAVNYGPGEPVYAHKEDEQIKIASLVESYICLQTLISQQIN